MATSIQDRRKRRELEAKRDKLLEMKTKNKNELAKVRAELKVTRVRRASR